ncbi:MAG TPA: hypothetical protein VF585_09215 [Chthoniobacterales bacterium]
MFDSPIPIEKIILLSSIGYFDARLRVQTQPAETVKNLKAMERLGNSQDGTLIASWANSFVQTRIVTFIAEHGETLPPALRANLSSGVLGEAALVAAFQESIRGEQSLSENAYAALEAGRKENGDPLSGIEKRVVARMMGTTPDEIRQHAERLRIITAKLGESLYMRDEKFRRWQADFRARHPAPSAEGPVEHMEGHMSFRETARSTIVTQAMARAALSIFDQGPSALTRYRDPLTGKVFGYRVVDANGSFELQSEVLRNDKPVTLTFQRGAKK